MPEKPPAGVVIVDVQKAFDDPAWGKRSNPGRKGTSRGFSQLGGPRTRRSSMFDIARQRRDPVWHFFNEGDPRVRVQAGSDAASRMSRSLTKGVNSAFIGTDLESGSRSGRHHGRDRSTNDRPTVGQPRRGCRATSMESQMHHRRDRVRPVKRARSSSTMTVMILLALASASSARQAGRFRQGTDTEQQAHHASDGSDVARSRAARLDWGNHGTDGALYVAQGGLGDPRVSIP